MGCQWYFDVIPIGFQKDVGFLWDLFGVPIVFFWGFHEISMGLLWDFYWISV